MQKFLRLIQAIELADVEETEVGLHETYDVGTMAHGEVEVNDAKLIGEAIHQGEQTGREAMDATEREGE